MAKKKKYNLLKVKGLMVLSLLLLTGFIGYWLYAQYEDEKDQLKKDIAREFEATQRSVTDTAIFVKLTKELNGGSADILSGKTIRSRKRNRSMPTLTMTIGESDSEMSQVLKQLEGIKEAKKIGRLKNNGNERIINKISFTSHDTQSGGKARAVTRLSGGSHVDSTFTKVIVAQGMKMIVTEIINLIGDTLSKNLLDVDTALIKRTFTSRLQQNGYSLDVTFVGDYDKHKLNKKSDEIYVDEEFFGHTYGMSVTNYSTQLFKGITPQILFSLFLVALTLAAFLFTYRSLKDQIKLGIIKNDFISNMSHELKTPISTVKVAIEALTNYNMLQDPVKTREYLEMAAIEMDRLEMLVSQALNASLIEGGRITIKKEIYDLHNITEEVCKAMQLRFEQNDAKVNIDINGSDFSAAVDKLHIQGVLINLLDNSLKYADKQPEINIALSKTAGDIKITIADNGPGIPKEYIDKVFDKFFRVPTGDRHNVKGFGLGLAYSQQIMQQHGGSIDVYNKPGGGCVFILIIPKTS